MSGEFGTYVFDMGGDRVATTRSSQCWLPATMLKLKSLVQNRNRFVCLQLVTMAQEQYARVRAALEASDPAAVQQAQHMYLSTLEAAQELVAAAIFYPRAASKDGQHFPHVYVELICCCVPGKGYGTLLLQHIEQFVKQQHQLLAEAFIHDPAYQAAAAAVRAAAATPSPTMTVDSPHYPVPSPQPVSMAPKAPLEAAAALAAPATGGAGSLNLGELQLWSNNPGLSAPGTMVSKATPTPSQQQQQQQAMGLLSTGMDLLSISSSHSQGNGNNDGISPVRTGQSCAIKGIKLLSVESARGFYERNGYRDPDACHEMFKSLQSL